MLEVGGSNCRGYPWETLEVLPRAVVSALAQLRRKIPVRPGLDQVAELLRQTLQAGEVHLTGGHVGPLSRTTAGFPKVQLRLVDTRVALDVALEPSLAADVLARLCGEPMRVPPVGRGLDAFTTGALSALVADVARRLGGGSGGFSARLRRSGLGESCAEYVVGVSLEGRSYTASVRFAYVPENLCPASVRGLEGVAPDLPVALSVIVSCAALDGASLSTLRPGDVLCFEGPSMPEGGALAGVSEGFSASFGGDGVSLVGPAVLGAARGEGGVLGEFAPGGAFSVGCAKVAIPVDAESAMMDAKNVKDASSESALESSLLEAPVIVRAELGSVEMTVQEWSELGPGDVFTCGRRVGDPALLRIAGRVVAKGELVNVEGELGIRVLELNPSD